MSRFLIESRAQRDLVGIVEYLLEQARNPRAADAFLQELERKCEVYARQPMMGDLHDDLGEDLRSFTFRRWYVAIYQPREDGIRVFDARSDYFRHFDR
jgi:plasmid stabilization system protein ParE